MKLLFIALSVMGCAVATAKPHPPKHMPPHARVCHECDGHGVVRTWKKMWVGMRQCKKCDGRGFTAPKPPPPKAHDIKHPHRKTHDVKHGHNKAHDTKHVPAAPMNRPEKSRRR